MCNCIKVLVALPQKLSGVSYCPRVPLFEMEALTLRHMLITHNVSRCAGVVVL